MSQIQACNLAKGALKGPIKWRRAIKDASSALSTLMLFIVMQPSVHVLKTMLEETRMILHFLVTDNLIRQGYYQFYL